MNSILGGLARQQVEARKSAVAIKLASRLATEGAQSSKQLQARVERWCREAALSCGDEDLFRLAIVLTIRAGLDTENAGTPLFTDRLVEILTLLDNLADRGHDAALVKLQEVMAALPSECVRHVREFLG
jgi:hypothetical protein